VIICGFLEHSKNLKYARLVTRHTGIKKEYLLRRRIINMEQTKLREILELHSKWLAGNQTGKRANLQRANLREADLQGANLREADLQGANLREADLQRANLQGANLQRANLRGANLQWANLQGADLQGADLQGANLDFSCWPLWCGSKNVKVDIKIVYQLIAHLCVLDCNTLEYNVIQKVLMPYAVKSHRAGDLGLVKGDN
jgi:uncharacterized protein YjbI with pentapeptide repeats